MGGCLRIGIGIKGGWVDAFELRVGGRWMGGCLESPTFGEWEEVWSSGPMEMELGSAWILGLNCECSFFLPIYVFGHDEKKCYELCQTA